MKPFALATLFLLALPIVHAQNIDSLNSGDASSAAIAPVSEPTFCVTCDAFPTREKRLSDLARSAPGAAHSYIETHKELLANDALVGMTWSAIIVSSIRCQHASVDCIEQSPILGPRPSDARTIVEGAALAGAQITMTHLIWHFARGDNKEHLIWWITVPFLIGGTWDAYSNVRSTK